MAIFQPSNNAIRAVQYFLNQGLPYNVAVGLTGNLMAESNLNPNIESERDDQGRFAYGIGQWRGNEEGGRQYNLRSFLDSQGQQADPFMSQLKFLSEELNPKSPYYDSLSGQRFEQLMQRNKIGSVTTVPDITKELERAIFRSDGAGMDRRIDFADKLSRLGPGFFKNFKGRDINPTNLLAMQDARKPKRGVAGGLLDVFTNPARGMDRRMLTNDLMLILNSMSTRPDSGLAQSIGMEQQQLAQLRASKGAFGGMLNKEQLAFANQLKDDLRIDLRKYVEARDAYNQLLAIFPENTPGGTFAFITAFVKTTDPGSVVRGEEMKAVQNSGNIIQSLKEIILANMDMTNRTATLPREIREQMMTVAYKAIQSRTKSAVTTYNGALNVAQKQNIPAEYIWFGIPPGDAEEPDFTVLDDVEMEDKKNQDPPKPVVDRRTQQAIKLGVTIQEWNVMPPHHKILFKD